MITVTYNGQTDRQVGCHAKGRPTIPAPVPKVQTTDLRGMDGSYYADDGLYYDISIDVTFSLNSSDHSAQKATVGDWMALYRKVKKWLYSTGDGKLIFSDDNDHYYKVKSVTLMSDRGTRMLGEVTATFICDGYTYRADGDTEVNVTQETSIENPYEVCHPLYRLVGTGTTTLTVNDHAFTVTVNGITYIDTEKMITYNRDGEWVNTTARGDYEDLWLYPGSNSFATTNTTIQAYITPRWRCL